LGQDACRSIGIDGGGEALFPQANTNPYVFSDMILQWRTAFSRC
jgi:hypothetical protein